MPKNILHSLSMKSLLLSAFAIIILLVTIAFAISTFSSLTNMSNQAEKRELTQLYKAVLSEIEAEGRLAKSLAYSIANFYPVQEAFHNKERDKLITLNKPFFAIAKDQYGVKQFQFHTPPAISFLRLHKVEKFGDDLSGFRNTVVDVNNTKKPVSGIEAGKAGLGIRGVVPVAYNGKHMGSVEFGMALDNNFVERIKNKYGIDINIYAKQNDKLNLIASSSPLKFLSTSDLNKALVTPTTSKTKNGSNQYALYGDKVTDYAGVAIGVIELVMDRSEYLAQINDAKRDKLIISVFVFVLGLSFAYWISTTISKPLNSAVNAMAEIADGDGDLTKRLEVVGDNEFARLAKAFNDFAEKVRKAISKVSKSSDALNRSVHEVNQMMDKINTDTANQRDEITSVATAITEMTSTIHEVSNSGNSAAKSADKAEKESTHSIELLTDTVSAIEKLVDKIANATNVISQVNTESNNIGAVLDVIRGIAEQTNLLALNAAIEAARAGEQGRGFAVVADEVRTLASRTQASTEEINSMISSLQTRVKEAVSVIDDSRKQAESGVALTKSTESSIQTVKGSVTDIRDMNYQIATAVEEQSYVSDEINKNTTKIDELANSSLENVELALEVTMQVRNMSKELDLIVKAFKI